MPGVHKSVPFRFRPDPSKTDRITISRFSFSGLSDFTFFCYRHKGFHVFHVFHVFSEMTPPPRNQEKERRRARREGEQGEKESKERRRDKGRRISRGGVISEKT